MGSVYQATHLTLNAPVAIKVLPLAIARRDPNFAARFLRKAQLAARIRHPNVITVMDTDHDPATDLHYIVLEYVDGGTVRDLLREGPLDERRAIEIVQKITEALACAAEHRIIHRDIKPENIMLTRDGQVKLADLGLAKDVAESEPDLTLS